MPTSWEIKKGAETLLKQTFNFDSNTGNLLSRTIQNGNNTQSEAFTYDNLDRLLSFGGKTISYDNATGNITQKSGIGVYTYDPVKKHAVTGISEYESVLPDNQTVEYNVFKKPSSIFEAGKYLEFVYGTNFERIKSIEKENGMVKQTKYFIGGSFEKIIDHTTSTETSYTYIGGYYNAFAVYKQVNGEEGEILYLQKDYLGSTLAVTNAQGNTVERHSYDAWGRERNPDNWNDYTNVPAFQATTRGYTGHEHLAGFDLINMNGRLYDPLTSRFLSPDPIVDNSANSQAYNSYSYCLNNPLIYTDPSGNTWKIFKWIKEATINSFELGQDITVFATAPTAGFLTGFIDKAFNNRGDGTWFGAGFNNGKEFTINGFKINAGVSDALSTESRFTIFGAVSGALTSQYFNYTNQVVEVKSFYGTTVVRLRTDKVDYAMTFGNFIMGHTVATSINDDGVLTIEESVLIHEYGHYLQSLKFGPINYMKIGLNSMNHNREYDPYKGANDPDAWAERDASLRGLEFFRALGYPTNGFGENTWPENIQRDYWNPKNAWL